MARRIEKQANGLFAIWSTVVDDYVLVDQTEDQVVEACISPLVESLRDDYRRHRDESGPADEKLVDAQRRRTRR